MDFLFYCRDRPETGALLQREVEANWSFMDTYADRLLVRGPTLTEDGESHTGSLHIVRLTDATETETFAYQEPFYRAGLYDTVSIRHWQDRPGRPMRDFKANSEDPLFLLLGTMHDSALPPDLPPQHRESCAAFGWT